MHKINHFEEIYLSIQSNHSCTKCVGYLICILHILPRIWLLVVDYSFLDRSQMCSMKMYLFHVISYVYLLNLFIFPHVFEHPLKISCLLNELECFTQHYCRLIMSVQCVKILQTKFHQLLMIYSLYYQNRKKCEEHWRMLLLK